MVPGHQNPHAAAVDHVGNAAATPAGFETPSAHGSVRGFPGQAGHTPLPFDTPGSLANADPADTPASAAGAAHLADSARPHDLTGQDIDPDKISSNLSLDKFLSKYTSEVSAVPPSLRRLWHSPRRCRALPQRGRGAGLMANPFCCWGV